MIDRRRVITAMAAGATLPLTARSLFAQTAMSRMTAYSFSFQNLKGGDIRLADYAGKPVLVVNTASLCGFTPQYAGLQELWTQFRDRGLMVIGVPSNDFGAQEPGGASDIAHTAEETYHVSFPITAKTSVKGPNAHPFYKWAATERPGDLPGWNFHKYLVGRDGHIADAFSSRVEPTDTRVVTAVARALTA
ncbi:MAG: glutathione peroxidase [Afipia sp.]|nr:glutathione peroxidase [Afipia sp.]MBS4004733.1 glutathione peroxidase [Afipia sp.]WIG51189.1 MAG: Glutathione peroxidase [Afipia sp.]